MKIPPWLEMSALAGALIVAMLIAMWVQRPSSTCALSPDVPRRLVLSRETDREHLTSDVDSAARIARRYASAASSDENPDSLFLDCRNTLLRHREHARVASG
jgi:hypothetical protein